VKIKDMEGFKTKKGIEHPGMDYLPRKQYTKASIQRTLDQIKNDQTGKSST